MFMHFLRMYNWRAQPFVVLTVDAESAEGCSPLECPDAVVNISGPQVDNVPPVALLDDRLGRVHNNVVIVVIERKSINSSGPLNDQLCAATHWAIKRINPG